MSHPVPPHAPPAADPAPCGCDAPLDWRPLAVAEFEARIAAADARVRAAAVELGEAKAEREDLGTALRTIRELAA